MKVQSFGCVLVLGFLVGSTPVVAQDTIFISLGDSLIHPDTPVPDPMPTNTPGQVVGGMTGTFWNVSNNADGVDGFATGFASDNFDENPLLSWSDGADTGGFMETARGGGGSGSGSLDTNPGVVHWWATLGSNGIYDAAPDDPSVLSGILSGPAGTHGHSWQKSTAVRIRDLPMGTYEIYATGVPYERHGGFGSGNGQDVDMYIGTVFHTATSTRNLEDDLAAGLLTKTTLTHENYTSWELGDNYAKTIVTIDELTDALMVGVDMSFQGAEILGTLGTIEIRKIVTQVGDLDIDGDVDGNDFLEWQRTDGTLEGLAVWQDNYGNVSAAGAAVGAVPEPASLVLFGLSAIGLLGLRQRKI